MASKRFIASSELFEGYEVIINLNDCSTLDDIINSFYDNLQNCLRANKFTALIEELKDSQFYIKDMTFEDILQSDDPMIYIHEN
tara:strand:- start:495 stop:746 length:252 start_codon:yes stop_codon:yes gene_type:complete